MPTALDNKVATEFKKANISRSSYCFSEIVCHETQNISHAHERVSSFSERLSSILFFIIFIIIIIIIMVSNMVPCCCRRF